MGPDEDLPTLIQRSDHLNILRYIRAHELRKPELVVKTGILLLGEKLDKKLMGDESARLAALEQICLAAIDINDLDLSDTCLSELRKTISKDSIRFRCLLARCLESSGNLIGAELLYDALLKENPSNLVALQRKYCLLRSQPKKEIEAMEALNKYLEQNMSDTSAWYEMAKFRMTLGDFKGAAYALEEVVLGCPLESSIHCELAEVYATIGGIDNLSLARKHMAQSLELDFRNRRAQFGLVNVSKKFLEAAANATKKNVVDDHEIAVAKELLKFGTEELYKEYEGDALFDAVNSVNKEHTEGL